MSLYTDYILVEKCICGHEERDHDTQLDNFCTGVDGDPDKGQGWICGCGEFQADCSQGKLL